MSLYGKLFTTIILHNPTNPFSSGILPSFDSFTSVSLSTNITKQTFFFEYSLIYKKETLIRIIILIQLIRSNHVRRYWLKLTNLLVGLRKKSELPKIQDDTTTVQEFMYILSSLTKSNPVFGNPSGPFMNPQWIVWLVTWKDCSLSSSVWWPPNLGVIGFSCEGVWSVWMYCNEKFTNFQKDLGSLSRSTESINSTSQGLKPKMCI